MTRWFGESWGAPCCDPEDHVSTPLDTECLECSKTIVEGDQGVVMPCVGLDQTVTIIAYHIDCYLKKILPHTFDCGHCRGRPPRDHVEGCRFATLSLDCDCYHRWATVGVA